MNIVLHAIGHVVTCGAGFGPTAAGNIVMRSPALVFGVRPGTTVLLVHAHAIVIRGLRLAGIHCARLAATHPP